MTLDDHLSKLKGLVLEKDASILYQPLDNEVDYREESFPLKIYKNQIVLPSNREADPFYWAQKCKDQFERSSPYILIPGTKFDLYGTRHGKGGGWYDRFLSSLDNSWLRVGIAYKSQISKSKLKKEEWDEIVDWVIFKDNSHWRSYQIKSD